MPRAPCPGPSLTLYTLAMVSLISATEATSFSLTCVTSKGGRVELKRIFYANGFP